MILYLAFNKPFATKTSNNLNLCSELIILISFISTFIMNVAEMSVEKMEIWGWFLAAIVLCFLVVVWILMIPEIITNLIESIKEWCESKKAPRKPAKKKRILVMVRYLLNTIEINIQKAYS